MSNFSRRFKELRIEKRVSQGEIATALHVSRSTIGNYEQGTREPNHEKLEEIADYFNIDIDYLIGRKDWTTTIKNKNELAYDDDNHTWDIDQSYYSDSETDEYADFLRTHPEHKVLFDAVKSVKKEDLAKALRAIGIFTEE